MDPDVRIIIRKICVALVFLLLIFAITQDIVLTAMIYLAHKLVLYLDDKFYFAIPSAVIIMIEDYSDEFSEEEDNIDV